MKLTLEPIKTLTLEPVMELTLEPVIPEGGYAPTGKEVSTLGGKKIKPVTKEDTKRVLKQVAKSTAEIAAGVGETGLTIGSGIVASSSAGLAGMTTLATGQGLERAKEVTEYAQEQLTYIPRTEAGMGLVKGAEDVFKPLDKLGEWVGSKIDDPTLAAAAHSAIISMPVWAGYAWSKVKPTITKSTWYRKLKVKERGIVLQSLEELHKKGTITKGQLIREQKKTGDIKPFEKAVKERGIKQKGVVAELEKEFPGYKFEYEGQYAPVKGTTLQGFKVTGKGIDRASFSTKAMDVKEAVAAAQRTIKGFEQPKVPTQKQLQDYPITEKMVIEETGETVTIETNANRVVQDLKERRDLFLKIMDCVSG